MKLIIGLGNPGKKYADTRHNAGFMALDVFAQTHKLRFNQEDKFFAEVATTFINDEKIILAKPTTYMNDSGRSVQALMSFYKTDATDVLIVHDELDLAPGSLAFIVNGGHAGHNGVASIYEHLNRQDLARLRIGVGRATPPMTSDVWVLGAMAEETAQTCTRAAEAIQTWIDQGLAPAMNTWNRKSIS